MQVICLKKEAFYTLVEEVIKRLKTDEQSRERWISDKETMKLLGIKSKTTLQKLRDNGDIRFSQPIKKIIRYDRLSIEDYLDRHAKNPF